MSIFGGILTDGLIAYFDANNPQSLKNNGKFYLESLVKWKKTITDNIDLNDYGLTAYDIGLSTNLTGTTKLLKSNNKLQLYPISSLDSTGGTIPSAYTYTTAYTGNKLYLQLQGGWFQNFFKLEDYNWELLPYRYNNGLTLETWIKIDNTTSALTQQNSGIFLYLGVRGENKFSTLYSGDSGYTTSTGIPLGPDNIDLEQSIYNNVISFGLNKNLQLGYKYINSTGLTIENYSENSLTSGNKHIVITFKPCTVYPDDENGGTCGSHPQDSRFRTVWSDVVDCLDRREGQLSMYVNGRLFFQDKCFPEQFWFKGLDTEREKQIGVGYTISLGGGSFGLKYSYHYEQSIPGYTGTTYFEQDSTKNNLLIESNFQGGFYGGVSVLRVYNSPLNSEQVKLNYNVECQSYGLRPFKGGRVIYT